MKVIQGGKAKCRQGKPTQEEKRQKQKLKFQAMFLRNIDKLIPLDEVLDKEKFEFEMTNETTEEGLTVVVLRFRRKGRK